MSKRIVPISSVQKRTTADPGKVSKYLADMRWRCERFVEKQARARQVAVVQPPEKAPEPKPAVVQVTAKARAQADFEEGRETFERLGVSADDLEQFDEEFNPGAPAAAPTATPEEILKQKAIGEFALHQDFFESRGITVDDLVKLGDKIEFSPAGTASSNAQQRVSAHTEFEEGKETYEMLGITVEQLEAYNAAHEAEGPVKKTPANAQAIAEFEAGKETFELLGVSADDLARYNERAAA